MRGFPKHLNSPEDVDYCLKHYPKETEDKLKEQISGSYLWAFKRKLAAGDSGLIDETHQVIEVADEKTLATAERHQMELVLDANKDVGRPGLGSKEVLSLINDEISK